MEKPNVIIRKSTIVDGIGRPGFRANVAVGDKIATIGHVPRAGGIGISSCYDHLHDGLDEPMPAACADYDERLALARVCAGV